MTAFHFYKLIFTQKQLIIFLICDNITMVIKKGNIIQRAGKLWRVI